MHLTNCILQKPINDCVILLVACFMKGLYMILVFGKRDRNRCGKLELSVIFYPVTNCLMTWIQTGGIWILRHELLGQLSDIFSAHQGKAPCPSGESTVPRLGKQRAHFSSKCSHQDVYVISCNSLPPFAFYKVPSLFTRIPSTCLLSIKP